MVGPRPDHQFFVREGLILLEHAHKGTGRCSAQFHVVQVLAAQHLGAPAPAGFLGGPSERARRCRIEFEDMKVLIQRKYHIGSIGNSFGQAVVAIF